jgi:hypothetical protein
MVYADIFIQYLILGFALGIGWKWSERCEAKAAKKFHQGYEKVKDNLSKHTRYDQDGNVLQDGYDECRRCGIHTKPDKEYGDICQGCINN